MSEKVTIRRLATGVPGRDAILGAGQPTRIITPNPVNQGKTP